MTPIMRSANASAVSAAEISLRVRESVVRVIGSPFVEWMITRHDGRTHRLVHARAENFLQTRSAGTCVSSRESMFPEREDSAGTG
jgi:hypothetical protein